MSLIFSHVIVMSLLCFVKKNSGSNWSKWQQAGKFSYEGLYSSQLLRAHAKVVRKCNPLGQLAMRNVLDVRVEKTTI